MFSVFVLLVVLSPKALASNETCESTYLDDPVAAKHGDFVIGGLFQIGNLREYRIGQPAYCDTYKIKEYNVQKAIVLRGIVEQQSIRFQRDFNKTLGYELYDSCGSTAVTARASARLAKNPNVVGVSSVDFKEHIARSAGITSPYQIPTFVYLYNDDELMIESKYPTVFSMIDTEVNEAEITIQFLKKMGFKYMDIWYHKFSKEMAEHIYNSYVKQVGCGRIEDVTYSSHLHKIGQKYNETKGSPSQVQLILQNSGSTTRKILSEMVNNLRFRDKIYVFGISNGRKSYQDGYAEIVAQAGDNTLIFPEAELLNIKLDQTSAYLNRDWKNEERRDPIDDIYINVQDYRCPKGVSSSKDCALTSWLPYMVGGVNMIIEALHDTLSKAEDVKESCMMDFRKSIFEKIVNESNTLSIELEENIVFNYTMENKTVNSGYGFSAYQTRTKSYGIIGRGFYNRMDVENGSLLQEISRYNKTCSSECKPGTHRLWGKSVLYLPCCWTCEDCKLNSYSIEKDSNVCDACTVDLTSNDNNTGCVPPPKIYAKYNGTSFVVVASGSAMGTFFVIVFGVMVMSYEKRPVIKASDPGYLYSLLVGLLIGYPTAIIPMLKPSTQSCNMEYYAFVVFSTLISTNLLYKCVKVYDIFAAAKNFEPPVLGKFFKTIGHPLFNIFILSVTAIILTVDTFTGTGAGWGFREFQKMPHESWFLMCYGIEKKSMALAMAIPTTAFFLTLILAFQMRNFPHNFKESLNIFCATFVVIFCSAMFLASYSYSAPEVRSFLRGIVLLLTSTAFLFSIFLPKIYFVFASNQTIEEEREVIKERVRRFSNVDQPPPSPRPSTTTIGNRLSVTTYN